MNSRITQSARPKPTRTELEACRRNSGLPVLFTLTLFLSAALLFLIQPMFAKMVLPLLGGTPSVWNTCMVFFQAVLLAGYAYAHAAATRLGVRRQALLHLVLLLIPFLVLPISLAYASAPPADANPIPWLLCLLAVRVGLPFFVVATTSPLMQRWFARTGYPGGKDPYFLYSAGNLGSMLALLSYPVLFEPLTTLRTQSWIWMGGYGVLVAMILGCAFFLVRKPLSVPHGKEATSGDCGPQTTGYRLQTVQRLSWIVLAFVPSSLMLSVTTYLTTDLAAIPLLWVIPLAIYLLTFILVFARRPPIAPYLIYRVLPIVVVALVFAMLSQATKPLWLLLSLHLLGFFLISMACHGELARQRPPVEHLTEYYLWLSVGGVLGGLFNALIAPLIFRSVLEYPLVLMLGCMLPASTSAQAAASKQQPNRKPTRKQRRMLARAGERGSPEETACPPSPLSHVLVFETFLVLLPGALAAGLSLILRYFNLEKELFGMALIFGLPVLICYTFIQYRVRFGLAIGFLLFAGMSYQGVYGETVCSARSFFGIHRVTIVPTRDFYNLVHGQTVHGSQRIDSAERAEPFTYYHRSGPIGQVFTAFRGKAAKENVAIVGLGAGSLAYYGEPGQHFTYYEIDPTVLHIARDSGYFTFLRDCKASVEYVLGDARLTLQEAPPKQYGIIVMDAFSSDAIPLHLLTREALAIYKEKLTADGIIAFHISNGYLDLTPALGALARDANLVCWWQEHIPPKESEGIFASQWVLMAHRPEDLEEVLKSGRWEEVKAAPGTPVWTDDFSNIFSALSWR